MSFRNTLKLSEEETLDKLKDSKEINLKLKNDLERATTQLISKYNDLINRQSELNTNRHAISVSIKITHQLCFCKYSVIYFL